MTTRPRQARTFTCTTWPGRPDDEMRAWRFFKRSGKCRGRFNRSELVRLAIEAVLMIEDSLASKQPATQPPAA